MPQINRYWALSLSWMVLIYSTLYIVRPICEFLKSNTPFGFIVSVSAASILIFIAVSAIKKSKKVSSVVLLSLIIMTYVMMMCIIKHPEEKIHLAEYGILAYLLFMAIKQYHAAGKAYFLSFMLTSLFGWLDEVIQHFLPNRYYQNSDVLLNVFSAGLGILVVHLFRQPDKY